MEKAKKIIIDTDIGDDIDDAFALLAAMESGFDIVGVTTVFQNTVERARITKRLMKLYGKGYENVPVYAGHSTPLSAEKSEYPHLCQYSAELESEDYAPNGQDPDEAVNFIIDCCYKYGKELSVVAIGPFTNIAKVIEKDKNALNMAGRVVIMGGAYFKQYSDWNVICDVEAAKIMFESVNDIKCYGADVTHMLKISVDDDKAIASSKKSEAVEYIAELYEKWKQMSGGIGVLHDPLVMLCIDDEELCRYEKAPVAVIDSGFGRGLTLNVSAYSKSAYNDAFQGFDKTKCHTLAREVDREKVIKRFMECFK
jgi:purine nucleosidase/pyrimidine-specific ribonucleoside hydrolase